MPGLSDFVRNEQQLGRTAGAGSDDWFAQQGAPGGGAAGTVRPNYIGQGTGDMGGAGGGGATAGGGNPTDPAYVRSQLANWYASQGLTPTGPGTGPTDIEYYTNKILETGGWTNQTGKGENNIGYWTSRIPQDLAEAHGGGPAGGPRPFGTSAAPQAAPFSYDKFQAPDALTMQNDPGYQARLQMGTDALQRSAAAKGTLLTGGTLKGLNRFAQDYASNEYGNVFNRALGAHTTNYNEAFQPWQANFSNALQSWQGNLNAQNQGYNQLFGLAGLGANAASGQSNANSAYANQAGNLLTDQGNAKAAATVGSANAWNNAAGQITNAASTAAQQYYLSRLLNPSGSGGTTPGPGQPGYGVLR